MSGAATRGVGRRAARGVLWSYGSLTGTRLLVLLSTTVLARLLTPRDFGLVALALVFTTLLDALRDFGLNDALIVGDDTDLDEQAGTAFSVTLLIGIVLALLIGAVSPLAAAFFDQPALVGLLIVLGLNLPLRALGLTRYSLAQRRLDFRSRTAADGGEVIVRAIVAIGLAAAGLGAWSLVLGYLAGTIAWDALLWLLVRARVRLRIRRGDLNPMLRFGGPLTLVVLIGTAMGWVDNLFVGKALGPAALGLYSVGYRLSELIGIDILTAVGLVLFPAFARLDGEGLHRAVLASTRYGMLIGLPLAAGTFALAQPIVLTLFGARWEGAVPVVRLLAVAFAGVPLGLAFGPAYMATKRLDVSLKLAIPQGILLVVALALFVHDGITAAAACQAGVRVLFGAIGVVVAMRVLGLRAGELWAASWRPLVATAGMLAVVVPLDLAIASAPLALVVGGLTGAAVYAALAWLLARRALRTLWALAVRRERVPVAEL